VQTPSVIAGASSVVAEFNGEWPSFHDAEVIRFALERAESAGGGKAVAAMLVHVRRYESRDVGTANYHQAVVKSVLIDFRFTDVQDVCVSNFNSQNVIDGITFSGGDVGAPVSVAVSGIYGFDGRWKCQAVAITAVSRGPSEA
jgi:hypothetical protein